MSEYMEKLAVSKLIGAPPGTLVSTRCGAAGGAPVCGGGFHPAQVLRESAVDYLAVKGFDPVFGVVKRVVQWELETTLARALLKGGFQVRGGGAQAPCAGTWGAPSAGARGGCTTYKHAYHFVLLHIRRSFLLSVPSDEWGSRCAAQEGDTIVVSVQPGCSSVLCQKVAPGGKMPPWEEEEPLAAVIAGVAVGDAAVSPLLPSSGASSAAFASPASGAQQQRPSGGLTVISSAVRPIKV